MRHRHIDVPDGYYSVAVVDSILERGGASDVVELLRVIREDPFSQAAESALTAAAHSDVYGYPAMVKICIERWRRERSQSHGMI
jgi:hypothetical protein